MKIEEVVHAVQSGNFDEVSQALESKSIQANACDYDGASLLHWAASNNRIKIAKLLLNAGADVNYGGGAGKQSPLEWALSGKYYYMAQVLYEHGADIQYTYFTSFCQSE